MDSDTAAPARLSTPRSSAADDGVAESRNRPAVALAANTSLATLLSFLLSRSDFDIDPLLADLIEEVTCGLQSGRTTPIEELVARDPARAELIRRLLPSLRMLTGLASGRDGEPVVGESAVVSASRAGRRLGDYHLLAELGRGGMGIVFEAVQESLGRRVALKILPTAAALDQRAVSRFQIEAQAAARLQHAHIVPIYAVGQVESIPYYAMQLIEGTSLAHLIKEMRRLTSSGGGDDPGGVDGDWVDHLVASLLSDHFAPTRGAAGGDQGSCDTGSGVASLAARTAGQFRRLSSETGFRSIPSPAYFRSVARLGIQAAEALDYAHDRGIIHRDVKPANLLLDPQGWLWVADFGMARLPTDSGLTLTGELLGTLRYMSPEQATGRPALVDRRTDVYSLGATLYEMLSLQPAFGGLDPNQILREVAERDPAALRTLNPAVPRDLAAIITKAMAKTPSARYATAWHLAEDLGRFLDGRPVEARVPSSWQRALKWVRRRPAVTALFLLAQVLMLALLVLGAWSYRQMVREAESARRRAETESLAHAASQRTSATLALERGIALAEGRKLDRGLLWMLRGLEAAPSEAADLRRASLINLAAWSERAPVIRARLQSGAALGALALSRDGRTVAVGGEDGRLQLWDADTGRLLAAAQTVHSRIKMLVFHPGGQLLATAGSEGRAQLWEMEPLRPRGEPMELADGSLGRVAFHPGGRSLLAAGIGSGGQLRSLDSGEPIGPSMDFAGRTLDFLGGAIFRSDGSQILSFSRARGARLWETATGRLLFPTLAHESIVECAAFRPDGHRLATAEGYRAESGRLRIWDTESGRLVAETPRAVGGFRNLAYHPDGQTIAAAGWDGFVRLFDAETGQVRGVPMPHAGTVGLTGFSPDGRFLATSGADGTVRFFDASTGNPLGTILEHRSLAVDAKIRPDGRGMVTASRDGSVCVWDISPVIPLGRGILYTTGSEAVEFSPDGRFLAADGFDGAARLFETATGRLILPPFMHAGRVRIARFSPDGRLLATGGDDSLVRLWDVATGKPFGPLMSQPAWVLNLRFSPDGRKLLVGTAGGVARLWDLDSFRPLGQVLRHPVTAGHEIWHVAFGAGGRVAITGTTLTDGTDATVGFWDTWTGDTVSPFLHFPRTIDQVIVGPGPDGPVCIVEGGRVHVLDPVSLREVCAPFGERIVSVAVHPSGTTLMTAGADRMVRIWDIASGKPVGPGLEHDEQVRGVAVTPDGTTLLTLARDRLRFWDIATREPLGPPLEHVGPLIRERLNNQMHVAFRPDGRVAATAVSAVVLWEVPGPSPVGGSDAADLADWVKTRARIELGDDGLEMVGMEDGKTRPIDRGASEVTESGDAVADWHDHLASEGERSGQSFMARWHLDRLIGVRPADWYAYARRARLKRREGDTAGAEADWVRARELGPAHTVGAWEAHEAFNRMSGFQSRGRWAEARAELRRIVSLVGEDPIVSWRLAEAEARLGLLQEAEPRLATAMSAVAGPTVDSPDHMQARIGLAALHLLNGHPHAYRAASQSLLEGIERKPSPMASFFVAWHCAIGPHAVDDPRTLVNLAEAALEEAPNNLKPILLAGAGAVLYRAGRPGEAVVRLERAERQLTHYRPQTWAFLAMAHQALGREAEARRWLARLRAHLDSAQSASESLWEVLQTTMLCREAEAIVILDPTIPADPFAP